MNAQFLILIGEELFKICFEFKWISFSILVRKYCYFFNAIKNFSIFLTCVKCFLECQDSWQHLVPSQVSCQERFLQWCHVKWQNMVSFITFWRHTAMGVGPLCRSRFNGGSDYPNKTWLFWTAEKFFKILSGGIAPMTLDVYSF
jgi:hypothetical protein